MAPASGVVIIMISTETAGSKERGFESHSTQLFVFFCSVVMRTKAELAVLNNVEQLGTNKNDCEQH
jgi:hypothetical protein